MSRGIAWALLALASAGAHAGDVFTVPPELWDRPRSARAVQQQPAVRQALAQFLAEPGSRLVVHHGYGQEPLAQAEELRAWLMALAVDGARVSLVSDVHPNEPLKIEVVK